MVRINHIALECDTREHAKMVFEDVFQCSLLRSFEVPSEFAEKVFSIKKEVTALVYQAENSVFEIFITGVKIISKDFSHVCIEVSDMDEFFSRCDTIGLKPYIVTKNQKQYVFVRDIVGNLFEVKEG